MLRSRDGRLMRTPAARLATNCLSCDYTGGIYFGWPTLDGSNAARLYDKFAGTDGQSLTAKPNPWSGTGAAWGDIKVISTAGAAANDIQSQQCRIQVDWTGAVVTPGTFFADLLSGWVRDPVVSVDWITAAGQDNGGGIIVRRTATSDQVAFEARTHENDVRLLVFASSDTPAVLATASYSFTAGQTYRLKVVCVCQKIKCYIDDELVLSAESAHNYKVAFPAHGIFRSEAGAGMRFDNFILTPGTVASFGADLRGGVAWKNDFCQFDDDEGDPDHALTFGHYGVFPPMGGFVYQVLIKSLFDIGTAQFVSTSVRVLKIDADNGELVWTSDELAVYFHKAATETSSDSYPSGFHLAIDESGNVYVTPTEDGFDQLSDWGDEDHCCIVKLNSSGEVVATSRLGLDHQPYDGANNLAYMDGFLYAYGFSDTELRSSACKIDASSLALVWRINQWPDDGPAEPVLGSHSDFSGGWLFPYPDGDVLLFARGYVWDGSEYTEEPATGAWRLSGDASTCRWAKHVYIPGSTLIFIPRMILTTAIDSGYRVVGRDGSFGGDDFVVLDDDGNVVHSDDVTWTTMDVSPVTGHLLTLDGAEYETRDLAAPGTTILGPRLARSYNVTGVPRYMDAPAVQR